MPGEGLAIRGRRHLPGRHREDLPRLGCLLGVGIRRAVLIAVVLTLALPGTAVAFSSGYLTVDSKEPGARTLATIDLRLPRRSAHADPIAAIAPRAARGTRFHNRAVARRCRNAQAAVDGCPAASRIGGGRASLESTPGGTRIPVDIDMYLAPRRAPEDQAGVLMVTRASGRTSYATGRVFELSPQVYPRKGLQLRLERLQRAFFGMTLRNLNVHFAAHRTIDGRRVDLLTNPGTCTAEGWPWTIGIEAPDGSGGFFHGAIDCSG